MFAGERQKRTVRGEIVKIEGIPEGYSAFNPASPLNGFLPVRLASQTDERKSFIALCQRNGLSWRIDDRLIIPGEDPYYTIIRDHHRRQRILFGRVLTGPHPIFPNPKDLPFTAFDLLESFYDLPSLAENKPQFVTPPGEKGVKPKQKFPDTPDLYDVPNRPQGDFEDPKGSLKQGGLGVINFHTDMQLSDLKNPTLYQPSEDNLVTIAGLNWFNGISTWGGLNAIYSIVEDPNKRGVFGHLAYFAKANFPFKVQDPAKTHDISRDLRPYLPFSGILDIRRKVIESFQILCTSEDFPRTPVRQIPGHNPKDLDYTVYTGGLSRIGNLYVGLRDATAARLFLNLVKLFRGNHLIIPEFSPPYQTSVAINLLH